MSGFEDSVVKSWYADYVREFFSTSSEFDDWSSRFRRDFVPNRSGRIEGLVKPVEKPVGKRGDVLFSELALVGRGQVTNDKCGKFRGYFGCLLHEKHEGDSVFAYPYFNYCDKPSCPECYRYGWAAKEAKVTERRLLAAAEKLGSPVEHIVCSLPKPDYGSSLRESKRKAQEILYSRGISGGLIIPHGNRVDDVTHVEYFSPHFHVLGFIVGGYGRCRNCARKWNCLEGCGGFDDRNHQLFLKDGYVVKVLGERLSVAGTVFYQLHHSSMEYGRKRARVATYFGSVGYNNLGVKCDKPRMLCPECGSQCGAIEYVGSKRLFVIPRFVPTFKGQFMQPYLVDGVSAWRVREFGDSHECA